MDALQFTKDLVAFESPSSVSNVAVSDYVEDLLLKLGFTTERVEYEDARGVLKCNIIGKKGDGDGGLGFFAHTDVVPVTDWFSEKYGPFDPHVKDERLYGRGSCDMKGSLACMLEAASRFSGKDLKHPVYITATADEEVGYHGARRVVRHSELYQEMADNCINGIVGEPTRLQVVHAHKGSCGFHAISRGVAAHSSTDKGLNANWAMIPFLVEMKAMHEETETDPQWQNEEFDPPTVSMNLGINDHTTAVNITPPQSICTIYMRPMPGQDSSVWLDRARAVAKENGLEFEVRVDGAAFYTSPDCEFVKELCDLADCDRSTTVSYGTDGSVLGEKLDNLVVWGPGDIAQAHTRDEWIALDQLKRGANLFSQAIRKWCC